MSKSGINQKGRSERTPGGWVKLEGQMLDCAAWKALTPYAHDLYIAIKRRKRNRGNRKSNNGYISMSRREAAATTGCSEGAMGRAFRDLIEKGFIKITRESEFNMKDTRAREYALTEFPVGDKFPTREFQHWTPQIQNTGTPEIPVGYTRDTREINSNSPKEHSVRSTGTPEGPVNTPHGYTRSTTSINQGKARSGGVPDSTNSMELGGKCSLASEAKLKFDISSITYWPAAERGDDNENEFNGTCPKCWQQ